MNRLENVILEQNIKVTIITGDNEVHTFLAEMELKDSSDIFTELPIDKTSEMIEPDEHDDYETFYSTTIGNLLSTYGSIVITQVTKNRNQ